MNDEQWKKAEEIVSCPYGILRLKIDGYNITVIMAHEKGLKYCLAVYVNGKIKGEWIVNDCEERRRFYHQVTKNTLTAKKKAEMIKTVGKRRFEKWVKENPELYSYKYYEPYFGSFRMLKSHFVKNNESIEMVEKFDDE